MKNEKTKPNESLVVSTRVTIPIYEGINQVLDTGLYLKVSDYLRDIIKKDLESRDIKLNKPK